MKILATKLIALILVMNWYGSNAQQSEGDTTDAFYAERLHMVKNQIIRRGIKNQDVINAMLEVPRHRFVDPDDINEAYKDHPLGIGEGQTISQPYIVAFMTEAMQLSSSMRVLEIGTGSGYQAAILSKICDSVFTIEVFESLGNEAYQTLQALDYKNIEVKIGDGYDGWSEKAPFDAIIVTCAPTHIPSALQEQLKEGGRMIIPVGRFYEQELVILEKKNGKIIQKSVLSVRFVPMIDEKGKKY